jgi:hypothetical protein
MGSLGELACGDAIIAPPVVWELEEVLTLDNGEVVLNCFDDLAVSVNFPDAGKQVQIRRRFQLLGQTVDGMRVWDVRRALAVVRSLSSVGATQCLTGGARWLLLRIGS